MTAVLHADRVSKRFGTVTALDDVSLQLNAGQVTCLLGDNGAGKSTLIQLLSGATMPTTGRMLLDGMPRVFASPRDARNAGISVVHQDLGLFPLMAIWRNFFLAAEPTRGAGLFRRIDTQAAERVTAQQLAQLGITLTDTNRALATMSGGERQCVAIARALHFGARVLIMDEPTAALGVKQSDLVLNAAVAAAKRGTAVLLVTHNPRHAYAVGDNFVVLQRGHVAASLVKSDTDSEHLAALMSS
jgi:simple sugar transport system ATP-binding protein